MRAMVLREYEQPLVLEDIPTRDPIGSEVVLKVGAAGVCGTDLKIARGRNRNAKLPRVLGHEFAGEVVALGPEVRQRKVGDRVNAYMYINCGQCEFCLTGHENLCTSRRGFFGFDRDGGFAEYVAVPEANLLPVPDSVSMEEAAIVGDAMGTSWHAVKTQANLRPGQTAVVVGLGGLGLHAVQAARACGALVVAVDTVPAKLEAARENGAHHLVDASQGDFAQDVKNITGGKGADAVIDFRAKTETLDPGIRSLKPGGTMVFVAYMEAGKAFPLQQRMVMGSEFHIVGAKGNTRQEVAEVIQMVAMGHLKPLIAERMGLEQVNEAIDKIGTGQVTGRIVLVP